jgi:hypothetical protein
VNWSASDESPWLCGIVQLAVGTRIYVRNKLVAENTVINYETSYAMSNWRFGKSLWPKESSRMRKDRWWFTEINSMHCASTWKTITGCTENNITFISHETKISRKEKKDEAANLWQDRQRCFHILHSRSYAKFQRLPPSIKGIAVKLVPNGTWTPYFRAHIESWSRRKGTSKNKVFDIGFVTGSEIDVKVSNSTNC